MSRTRALLSLVILGGLSLCIYLTWRPSTFIGNDITIPFDTGNVMSLSQSAQVEAASNQYFLFEQNGKSFSGVPTEIPLGWKDGSYYKAVRTQLTEGKWLLRVGAGITVHITNESVITVTRSFNSLVGGVFTVVLCILFLLGLALMMKLVK